MALTLDLALQLKALAKHARFAFEELTVDHKMTEANDLCNGNVNGMYQYLLTKLGSPHAVLGQLEAVAKLRRPYKSLVLDKNEELLTKGRRG